MQPVPEAVAYAIALAKVVGILSLVAFIFFTPGYLFGVAKRLEWLGVVCAEFGVTLGILALGTYMVALRGAAATIVVLALIILLTGAVRYYQRERPTSSDISLPI